MRPMHVAHPQINCKVTKCQNVVLIWVHTNNGTIPPLKVRGPTWSSHYHALSVSPRNICFKNTSTLVEMTSRSQTSKIQETHPQIKHKVTQSASVTKSPSVILTWVHSKIGTTSSLIKGTHLGSPTLIQCYYYPL